MGAPEIFKLLLKRVLDVSLGATRTGKVPVYIHDCN